MALAIGVALLIVGAGCSSDVSSDQARESAPSTTRSSRQERKPTIRIGVTDWTGARLNVALAERLIERRLGYPVEQAPVTDTRTMLRDLELGDLDAVLEIWPSSLDADAAEVMSSDRVRPLGELGVVGKIGWYLPRRVIDTDPSLASWEGLVDPAAAARFATAETGVRGRFLGTDPGYDQADEELIDALGLPFDVIYSGSDAATVAELERAEAAGDPVLLYWWTPTAEIVRFDLVPVALPERTEACVDAMAGGAPQRCDYPEDRLLKLGSPGLVERAPDVDAFLRRFAISTADQLAMIDQVDTGGVSVDQVVDDWIEANEALWTAWFG